MPPKNLVMPRTPRVPTELTARPFGLATAREAGLTKAQLLGSSWRRIGPETYTHRDLDVDQVTRLKAAMCRLPDTAVFSGPSAAFLHGLDPQCNVIEATLPSPGRIAHRAGIIVRRCQLESDDVVMRRGLRVTSAVRTVVDLACRLPIVEAVVVLDAALHRRLVRIDQLAGQEGRRGVRNLRRAIELAEPATESPMETRLRLLLVLAGLPRPQVQVSLGDATSFLGRVDLYYPDHRLVIEYDGATHRDRLACDNRRQNRLLDAGYRILRFSASDVLDSPQDVIALVRSAISATDPARLPKRRPRPARSGLRRGRVAPRAA
jgi:very-short-patch-repair endonuclease